MIIDFKKISQEMNKLLAEKSDKSRVTEILTKARELRGLEDSEVLALLQIGESEVELLQQLYHTASFVKEEIYGNRLVLFAPMYISNLCNNECLYCAFRSSNKQLHRVALNQEEIAKETQTLIAQGHKRILLVTGESYGQEGLNYIFRSIETIYAQKEAKGNIRRINVNIAPLQEEEFKLLAKYPIGTYQLFQETYHQESYRKLHLKGAKANYDFRLQTMDRALHAGLHDVGIGVLFGLYDWRYEMLAMLAHVRHLEAEFGVGPHTISVPRIEPAHNSKLSERPPYEVSDSDFKKIIAVLRLAVPYTGIILSTRESAQMRRDAFALGISQISAGSKTNPGGYGSASPGNHFCEEQFSLGDHRELAEVILDMVHLGYIPSFCTGCYRLGRVGADFMDLAKPGAIKEHCMPNALFTFAEYLYDFAPRGSELFMSGLSLIEKILKEKIANPALVQNIQSELVKIANGNRDIYW
ncbi:MAG: [FeFe] hydrogenase H-cluster radical SAM maturase HydG [Oligoflexia bacterium]|nr:[FeFe] hydrogenase H-cluster radical SAM maturase HydG [Oligoflexia bacterium]MBF0366796.1 [FeFe] hydrogenase H-cluster radical SAM maturase HydG [Oligoflexia bacterium]